MRNHIYGSLSAINSSFRFKMSTIFLLALIWTTLPRIWPAFYNGLSYNFRLLAAYHPQHLPSITPNIVLVQNMMWNQRNLSKQTFSPKNVEKFQFHIWQMSYKILNSNRIKNCSVHRRKRNAIAFCGTLREKYHVNNEEIADISDELNKNDQKYFYNSSAFDPGKRNVCLTC